MEDRFPDASCERCGMAAQLNTVPLRLVQPGQRAWQALCDDCFHRELGVEPWDELRVRPIRHNRRGRR
jgi:hypothetical protein